MEDRVVKIRRCAAVVKGGRRFSFNALVVVGDKQGRVAYGYGKANEVPPAGREGHQGRPGVAQAAPRRCQLRGDTIPHRVIGRTAASRVILVPAGPGTGVKAGPGVRDVLQAVRHPQHPDQGARQHQPDQPGQGDHRGAAAAADHARKWPACEAVTLLHTLHL